MFSLGMSVIFEINRDFPYQVELSFDELAMEVLAWLDERSFEWDNRLRPQGRKQSGIQDGRDADVGLPPIPVDRVESRLSRFGAQQSCCPIAGR
jgi:hypothetical protein